MKVHNAIPGGLHTAALTAALGDTKGEGKVERFGETIEPVINLWGLPEWCYLRKEQLSGQNFNVGPIAAEYSYAGLQNPAGSGYLAVVEAVSALSLTAALMSLTVLTSAEVTTAGLVAASSVARDTRWVGSATPATSGFLRAITGTHTAQLGALIDQLYSSTTDFRPMTVGLPFVLGPGFSLMVFCGTLNVGLIMNMSWRSRLAFKNELP